MANPNIDAIRELLGDVHFDAPTIDEQRAALEATAGSVPAPDGVVVEEVALGGRPAERTRPEAGSNGGVVLYLHGGGYCAGSVSTHRNLVGRLALAYGGEVASLEYRLAPEHPFPAALDDAVAAYTDLLDQGTDPGAIAVAGDSAGGGLTLATLLAVRDAGLARPAAGVCLSPWTDLTLTVVSYEHRAAADPMVSRPGLALMAAAYRDGRPADDPLISPALADLRGLPPLLVHVGDAEVLLDDAIAVRDAGRAGDVDVTFEVWPDMIHVFQAFPPELLPESDLSLEQVADFLGAHLALGS